MLTCLTRAVTRDADYRYYAERDEHVEASGVEEVLGPTTAGRTSQAATMVEKKTAWAPTIADATSQMSSEANTTDPSVGPSRPRAAPSLPWTRPFAAALHKRLVKSPLACLR